MIKPEEIEKICEDIINRSTRFAMDYYLYDELVSHYMSIYNNHKINRPTYWKDEIRNIIDGRNYWDD